MTTASGLRWYVVRTRPHAELKAVSHLQRQGFCAYLPRYLKRRRHARRTEIVPAPLFPRYLFVAVDLAAQRWRSIHSTVGVTHLVTNGDTPVSVAAKIVEELQQRHDERGFVRLDQHRRFAPGDPVSSAARLGSCSTGRWWKRPRKTASRSCRSFAGWRRVTRSAVACLTLR